MLRTKQLKYQNQSETLNDINCSVITLIYTLQQVCTNPGLQVTRATKFCTVVPNTCGSSAWNLLHVTLLAPRILRWFLVFWKIFAPLC
jgi:hypothetical protein